MAIIPVKIDETVCLVEMSNLDFMRVNRDFIWEDGYYHGRRCDSNIILYICPRVVVIKSAIYKECKNER